MGAQPSFVADDPRFVEMIRATQENGEVERIDTHGAAVFLVGRFAYKIKRPVSFPYMDLSTPEKRYAACAAEVRLNRRTAPAIYLGLAPLRTEGASWSLGALDAPVGTHDECVVVMRRFDQATLFDRLAESNRLEDDLVVGLAERIAAFHDDAAVVKERGGAREMRWVAEENLEELTARGDIFSSGDLTQLGDRTKQAIARFEGLMDQRMAQGFVRHCHGDLHLRNVCLVDGQPTIFDALEFNETLAITDTQYDLAYVLMDLLHRDRRRQANLLLNRYLERRPDHNGLALLPCFMSVRAAVRAKVSVSMAAVQHESAGAAALFEEARDYLRRAVELLDPTRPIVIALGGFSGSGKSTVARALAPLLSPAPGAVILRSDVMRKNLLGVDDLTRLGPEGYTSAVSQQVYDALSAATAAVAQGGFCAIADATFTQSEQRAALARRATDTGVPFVGVWLEAGRDTLIKRVTARHGDPSDADAKVVDRQLKGEIGPLDWTRVDADRPASLVAEEIARRVAEIA
jgi:aminoglycoside phosphotransferase family enzyme/predicted kinase